MIDAAELARLNGKSHDDAVSAFLQCCAAPSWAEKMARLRPYPDARALYDAAEREWHDAGPDAWRAAFAGHPRIGESAPTAGGGHAASSVEREWSKTEQAVASAAGTDARAELRQAQHAYEARFGHIFLICATGRSADDILAALRARMANDPDTELRIAAREQAAITRLRLEKMLSS